MERTQNHPRLFERGSRPHRMSNGRLDFGQLLSAELKKDGDERDRVVTADVKAQVARFRSGGTDATQRFEKLFLTWPLGGEPSAFIRRFGPPCQESTIGFQVGTRVT